MKKNNAWNIRRLVVESFVPASQRIEDWWILTFQDIVVSERRLFTETTMSIDYKTPKNLSLSLIENILKRNDWAVYFAHHWREEFILLNTMIFAGLSFIS